MTLTALYPYRDQPEVAAACAEAIEWLSSAQLATGGFPYGKSETSESSAWAIVALCTWGINPDTDSRFIKNGKSAVDNLLSYYVEADKMFAHQGTESNAMATDQASYALIAYDRLCKGKNVLYDCSDVGECTHDYKAEELKAPTDTESGYKIYVCSLCGDRYTETVAPRTAEDPSDLGAFVWIALSVAVVSGASAALIFWYKRKHISDNV
jgi:hypothetical protein